MTLLVVGVTLSLAVSERRREFGLLRAMGATRGQVVGLLLSEVLMVTAVGSVLGLAGGWLLSRHYLAVGGGGGGAIPFLPPATPEVLLLALLCTAAVAATATAAAFVPVWRGARVEPYDAIRGGG